MVRKTLSVLIAVLALVAIGVQADETVPVAPDTAILSPFDGCRIPSYAEPVEYVLLATFAYGESDDPLVLRTPQLLEPGQVMRSNQEYFQITGRETDAVDWDEQCVVIVEEYTSYDDRDLDSETRLTGVYVTGEAVIVQTTYTNYGPCQGIAQDYYRVSFESRYLAIVVPSEPQTVSFYECRIGDCPPDIP